MKGIIRKADIALAAVLLLFCAGTAWFAYGSGSDGADIEISVDGKLYGTYSLSEDDVYRYRHRSRPQSGNCKGRKGSLCRRLNCPDGYCLASISLRAV